MPTDVPQTAASGKRQRQGTRRMMPLSGIAEPTLYRQLKRFFERCAERMGQGGDRAGAARLKRASTHWLRHTHASHTLASGVPIQVAQQNLGHASIATTTLYVSTEKAARLRAMQWFWAKGE